MRYVINFDRIVNQLIPHYIGGRKLILYLQSVLKPLQAVNDQFVQYAKETRIEASMTSQPIMFEWYLNKKFSKYFLSNDRITISNGTPTGIPLYNQRADIIKEDNMLIYKESEGIDDSPMYHKDEKSSINSYSFIVSSPPIDTRLITKDKYVAMLSYYIDKYRLAGKSYTIKFNN